MLIYRRKHLARVPTKIKINWKTIGLKFGLSDREAHLKFDRLELKYLDKWSLLELNEMRSFIQK